MKNKNTFITYRLILFVVLNSFLTRMLQFLFTLLHEHFKPGSISCTLAVKQYDML